MNKERAAKEIKQAYATYRTIPGTNAYMPIWKLAELVDMNSEQITEGMIHLMSEGFSAIPESNQKALTQEARDSAIRIGNQEKHLIFKI